MPDNMGLETWKHLRAKLMLWPFHLRCKTMDFLDIQEMLMVIFNVSFKLNYISYIEWIRFKSSWGSVVIICSDVGVYGVIASLSFTQPAPNLSSIVTLSRPWVLTECLTTIISWQGLRKVRLPITITLHTKHFKPARPGFDIFREILPKSPSPPPW